MNTTELWEKILNKIKIELNSLTYQTWFEETKLLSLTNSVATIAVAIPMQKEHLMEHYQDLIIECFYEFTNQKVELNFVLEYELEEEKEEEENTDQEEDFYFDSNLQAKYTFDNFIIGNSNRFAQSAAHTVAEHPGETYNPLFIYGNSGLGKTHLMHAIGNYITEHSKKKVLYVTSEQFMNDFIAIYHKTEDETNFNSMDFFKKKYRSIDVLIIDDIQFLGNATESKKEFFHTFNNLYEDNKQIIISSDRSPNDLKVFEERLRTRFGWGLSVNIYPPDFELRIAILKKRIAGEAINIDIPEDVIEYMASALSSDVRALEGAVTRLVAYAAMMSGSKIDIPFAIEALPDYVNKGYSDKNDVSRIQKVVSEEFKVSIDELKSKKRDAPIAFPRQIAMYLCRKLTEESLDKIGNEFGGKDHTTVMHACNKIEKRMLTDKTLKDTIEKLEQEIK